MKYDKLVRDNVPEIIKQRGLVPITHIADEEEYGIKLREKLKEEVEEYIKSGEKEELSDLLEVIYAICDFERLNREELEIIRKDKREKRGGFEKKIILDEIKD